MTMLWLLNHVQLNPISVQDGGELQTGRTVVGRHVYEPMQLCRHTAHLICTAGPFMLTVWCTCGSFCQCLCYLRVVNSHAQLQAPPTAVQLENPARLARPHVRQAKQEIQKNSGFIYIHGSFDSQLTYSETWHLCGSFTLTRMLATQRWLPLPRG